MHAQEVCQVHATEGHECVQISPPFELAHSRSSSAQEWGIQQGTRVTKERGRKCKPAPFPAWAGQETLLLSGEAVPRVTPLLEPFGEFLPVELDGNLAYVFHCLRPLDAVDVDESGALYSVSFPGKILSFDHVTFKPHTIPEVCAFILPEPQPAITFFTGNLARIIMDTVDTTGIHFRTIWAEDEGHVRRPLIHRTVGIPPASQGDNHLDVEGRPQV